MDPDACAAAEGWHRDLEGVEVAVSDVMESYDLDPVTAKAGEMTDVVVMFDNIYIYIYINI